MRFWTPCHRATVGFANVSYFVGPLVDGGLPWCSLADVVQAVGCGDVTVDAVREELAPHFGYSAHVFDEVETFKGPVLVCAIGFALGFLNKQATREQGFEHLPRQLRQGAIEALRPFIEEHMTPFNEGESVEFWIAAWADNSRRFGEPVPGTWP